MKDHLLRTVTLYLYCVPNWLLSRPYDLIFVLFTQLTPFKTIWPNLSLSTQLTPFKTIWPDFCIVYPIDSFQDHLTKFIIVYTIDSFQDHLTKFLHCVSNWLLSRPFDLILLLCTQLTPFKTLWPDFCIVYPVDSFQDHLRSYGLERSNLCTQW